MNYKLKMYVPTHHGYTIRGCKVLNKDQVADFEVGQKHLQAIEDIRKHLDYLSSLEDIVLDDLYKASYNDEINFGDARVNMPDFYGMFAGSIAARLWAQVSTAEYSNDFHGTVANLQFKEVDIEV